ncbi:Hypothetical protein NTJ_09879 [Nesidiocoris tenuis]|uniref:Uncharacterized protein n=1 Tax=Nesidiocoris tenuis TaxID=355587 RepID=A0ABN7B1I8_9HEMI|nr:Hypothetical protein NTJ_09879 [Nesidiocoris tenuis]
MCSEGSVVLPSYEYKRSTSIQEETEDRNGTRRPEPNSPNLTSGVEPAGGRAGGTAPEEHAHCLTSLPSPAGLDSHIFPRRLSST